MNDEQSAILNNLTDTLNSVSSMFKNSLPEGDRKSQALEMLTQAFSHATFAITGEAETAAPAAPETSPEAPAEAPTETVPAPDADTQSAQGSQE